MSELTGQELDRVLREVIKRTLTDTDFRAKALADGTAAVALVAGKSLPSDQKFKFVDNSNSSVHTVVLPDPIPEVDQLLDEDLEQVAGGSAIGVAEPCNGSCSNSCLHT